MFTWIITPRDIADAWAALPKSERDKATQYILHDQDTGGTCRAYYHKDTDTIYIREINVPKPKT